MSIPKPVVAIFKAEYKDTETRHKNSNKSLSKKIKEVANCEKEETFRTIKDLLDLTQILYPKHYDNIIIMSHGNKNCLAVKNEELCARRGCCGGYTKDFTDLSENLENALKDEGEIWLYACKTGEATTFFDNFATSLAKKSKRTVYGSRRSLGLLDSSNDCVGINNKNNICIITNYTSCQNENKPPCENYDDPNKEDFIRFPKSAFKKRAQKNKSVKKSIKKKSTKKKSTKKSKVLKKVQKSK